jgi:hypothetical protein
MEGWKFWWGIAAFFLGGLSTQLNGWLTYRRQRADKATETADAARSRRDEFELQHLQATAETLRAYREEFLAAVHITRQAFKEAGPDGNPAVPGFAERVDAVDNLEGDVHAHAGYIFDERVRGVVLAASDAISDAFTRVLNDEEIAFRALNESYKEALDAISARVRTLYGEQPSGPRLSPPRPS